MAVQQVLSEDLLGGAVMRSPNSGWVDQLTPFAAQRGRHPWTQGYSHALLLKRIDWWNPQRTWRPSGWRGAIADFVRAR